MGGSCSTWPGRTVADPGHPCADVERAAVTGWDGLNEQISLGWFWGPHGPHRTVNHSGDDPGFLSSLAIVPDLRAGVAVLANCNTAPTSTITKAILDVLDGQDPPPVPVPPVPVPLGPVLEDSGVRAAVDLYRRLADEDPSAVDFDPDGFEEAVWGLIEMRRTDLAWPLLELWRLVQPDAAGQWLMTGWAHSIEGRAELALQHVRRSVELDPDNDEATSLLDRLTSTPRER